MESGLHSIVLVALPWRFCMSSELIPPSSDSNGAACDTRANEIRCCRSVKPLVGDVGDDGSAASKGNFMTVCDALRAVDPMRDKQSVTLGRCLQFRIQAAAGTHPTRSVRSPLNSIFEPKSAVHSQHTPGGTECSLQPSLSPYFKI
jgi:hypothetical protein